MVNMKNEMLQHAIMKSFSSYHHAKQSNGKLKTEIILLKSNFKNQKFHKRTHTSSRF